MSKRIESSQPAVLSEAGAHSEWIARPFTEAGLTLNTCSLTEVPERLATGKFNVLILGTLYTLRRTKQQEMADFARLREAIAAFLQKGGGVFLSFPSGLVGDFHDLFQPYGAGFLKLQIRDVPPALDSGEQEFGRQIAYTTEVSGPVAEGVEGVWYCARWGWHWGTRPVDAGEGWQVVLRGTQHSRTNAFSADDHPPPGFAERVPIMAVRDLGPARLAIFGMPSGYHISSPHTFADARRLLFEGFEGKPSGLLRLFVNTMEWLAEPSMKSGTLGGAKTDERVFRPSVPRFPDDPSVKWAERAFPPDREPLRGLIGARTAYSIGKGSVAEYVAKAKAAGLDFLVFLEDFKAMDSAKLQALKQECLAHTNETFFAVPGLTIEDIVGNHTFQYGYQIALPKSDILSPDGKRLAHKGPGGTVRNVRIDNVHSVYTFDDLQLRCRRGTYLHAQNPIRIYDLRCCDSLALVTWEDGRILDDARGQYRMIEDQGMLFIPTVLTFMNSPDDLDRAMESSWRNLVIEPYATLRDRVLLRNMAPELEWWGYNDEDLWRKPWFRFDNWQYSWPFQYMTSGPEIRAWAVSASGRGPVWRGPDSDIPPTADWFRSDVNGFRLRIKVTSEIGLDEILLFDGERPLRRWKANGARSFEQELDLVNHQQLNLQLEARDVRGGSAISQDFHTHRLDWCQFFCADRNNQLCIGIEKDKDGVAFGYSGTLYLSYNNNEWGGVTPTTGRWWYNGDTVAPVPRDPLHDEINPLDGGVTRAGAALHFYIKMPKLDPPERGLMLTPLREMISTDVAIGGMVVEHGWDPDWPGFFGQEQTGWSWFPVHSTRYLWLRRRAIVFRPRPHSLTTTLYTWDLRIKQAPAIKEPLEIGWLEEDATHVVHRLDGTRIPLSEDSDGRESLPGFQEKSSEAEKRRIASLPMVWRKGETIVSWTHGRRPAIFINEGVDLLVQRDSSNDRRFILALALGDLPMRGGTTRIQVAGIGGTHAHTDPDIAEKVRKAMGLAGEPAYALELHEGKLLSKKLVLALDGLGAGAAFRIPRGDLPMALPVMVHNLNENWPVFLVDRATSRWRPLGILEGTAYATVDTSERDWDVFIGHPVVASDPRAVLSLTQISPKEWALEVHNPTDASMTVSVSQNPLGKLLDWVEGSFSMEPGCSTILALQEEDV